MASPPPFISLTAMARLRALLLRGSRQGCVLGTLLFCLGLQPILEEASRGLDDLTVSAYIDDLAVTGPLEQISLFFERLDALSPTLGLSISLPKSSLLWSSDSQVPGAVREWADSHHISLLHDSVPPLGSMVGRDSRPRQQSAVERVRKMEPFFQALLHPLFTAQAAFLLLRVCALPKFLFACRTLPPRLTSAACASFDHLTLRTATNILRLDLDSLSEVVRSQLTLPLRYGGFGLRSMVAIAPAAFLGSLAAAARHMPHLVDVPLMLEIEHALSRCQFLGLKLPNAASFLTCAARRPPVSLQKRFHLLSRTPLALYQGFSCSLLAPSQPKAGWSLWLACRYPGSP